MAKKFSSKQKKSFKNSGYSSGGASLIKKTLKSWLPRHFSAVSDIDRNLETLRARSADLYLNSPIGHAAIATMVSGVVNEGLKLFPRLNHTALNLSVEQARAWESKTKQEFELWSENVECDFYRRNTFRELQRIAFLNQLTDGDCACLFRRKISSSDNPYSLRLQLIEAQRISNPIAEKNIYSALNSVEMAKGNSRIVNGIEVDRNGILKALWISSKIPQELDTTKNFTEWRRVKFFGERSGEQNLCFLCNDTRIEQFRGEPFLAPVIEILRNIYRYSDAELTSAILKTFLSVFFVQLGGDTNYGLNQIIEEDTSVDVTEYKLGAGTISALPRGVDVKSINPAGASSTFESFTVQLLKQVGAALNLPYEVLLKNFQSSYSASKAALLQAENEFRQRRNAFIVDFCEPVYRIFLAESIALGRIEAPGFFDDALTKNLWCSADWRNETNHSLDAQKEVSAAEKRILLGLSTFSRESAEINGSDYVENLKQLAKEKALQAELLPEKNSSDVEELN